MDILKQVDDHDPVLLLELSRLADDLLTEPSRAPVAAESSESESPVLGSSQQSRQSRPPSQHIHTTAWWAPLIKNHLQNHVPQDETTCPRTILSACSGVFPEGEVLKARIVHITNTKKPFIHSLIH